MTEETTEQVEETLTEVVEPGQSPDPAQQPLQLLVQ